MQLAVATINRINDGIAAFYINFTPLNFQSQHSNTVNHTHSPRASNAQQKNNSKLLSALKMRTNQLLPNTTVNTPSIQTEEKFKMSLSNTTPQTHSASTTGRVNFQSTPNLGVNSTQSSNKGPASLSLELSKEQVFENTHPTVYKEI